MAALLPRILSAVSWNHLAATSKVPSEGAGASGGGACGGALAAKVSLRSGTGGGGAGDDGASGGGPPGGPEGSGGGGALGGRGGSSVGGGGVGGSGGAWGGDGAGTILVTTVGASTCSTVILSAWIGSGSVVRVRVSGQWSVSLSVSGLGLAPGITCSGK